VEAVEVAENADGVVGTCRGKELGGCCKKDKGRQGRSLPPRPRYN